MRQDIEICAREIPDSQIVDGRLVAGFRLVVCSESYTERIGQENLPDYLQEMAYSELTEGVNSVRYRILLATGFYTTAKNLRP